MNFRTLPTLALCLFLAASAYALDSHAKAVVRIVTGAKLTSPTWSPNGRVIAFERTASRAAGPKIHSIDLTGRNERRLPTPADASDPAWGPIRP